MPVPEYWYLHVPAAKSWQSCLTGLSLRFPTRKTPSLKRLFVRIKYVNPGDALQKNNDHVDIHTEHSKENFFLNNILLLEMHLLLRRSKTEAQPFSRLAVSIDPHPFRSFQKPVSISVYTIVSQKNRFCSPNFFLTVVAVDLCFSHLHIEITWRTLSTSSIKVIPERSLILSGILHFIFIFSRFYVPAISTPNL